MSKTNIAIFASGSGSTAEAFIRDVQQNEQLDVRLLICNNSQAYVLERVQKLRAELGVNIASATINSRTQTSTKPITHGHQTDEEQEAILRLLKQYKIDLVLLLGYMKLVGPKLLKAYGWQPQYKSVYECRMLNTHPGLLPETIGTHGLSTQVYTLETGMKEAGQSLHAVSAEYDTGPVVAVHRVPVRASDTAASLFARVQKAEKQHLAEDVRQFIYHQLQYRKEQT